MKEKDINNLNHTSWRCQYHVVFAPKYIRLAIYRNKGGYRKDIKTVVSTKRSGNNRGRTVFRPYTYVDKYTTKV